MTFKKIQNFDQTKKPFKNKNDNIIVKFTCLPELCKKKLFQLERISTNIKIDDKELETTPSNPLEQRILVIHKDDYLPNTLKVAQAIALKIPIVSFNWVEKCIKMKSEILFEDGGWCFKELIRDDIKDCKNLFSFISFHIA